MRLSILDASVHGLNWSWIALMCTAPLPFAAAVAILLWRRNEPILGNLAGTVVIFGSALGFILRESVALDRLTRQCLNAGLTCWPQPSAFSRYAIYARHRTARSDRRCSWSASPLNGGCGGATTPRNGSDRARDIVRRGLIDFSARIYSHSVGTEGAGR